MKGNIINNYSRAIGINKDYSGDTGKCGHPVVDPETRTSDPPIVWVGKLRFGEDR